MKKILALALIITSIFAFAGCDNEKNNVLIDSAYEKEIYQDDEIQFDATEDVETSTEIVEEKESGEITVELEPVTAPVLSNKTYAWGFRRMKDGVQPEFTASYTKVLDDYEGIYVGNNDEKKIYLTFDEGYENGYTGVILDTLKEKEVTAIFFVTMPYVKQNPDLIRRMIDEGHIVGNHTVNHPSMPSVTDDEKLKKEIMGLHDYMVENYEYEMTYLRPPKGEYSERTAKIAKDLGYATVLWSSAYDDWDVNNQKGHEYAKKMILNYAHNGCVMLLHAVSKDNTEVLGEIIDALREREYEFYSLDDFER